MRKLFSKFAFTAALMLAITFTFSCSSDDEEVGGGSDKGNDIANYKTVPIGDQVWMAENLNYNVAGSRCYGEGGKLGGENDIDPNITNITLSTAEIQANCDKYGRLYDWATAMNLPDSCNSTSCSSQIDVKHQGICPNGWHIPSNDDWNVLMKFINPNCSDNEDCPSAGTKLKTKDGWTDYQGKSFGNGTDAYGFMALPGGASVDRGVYGFVGIRGNWWSASESNCHDAYHRYMYYNNDYVGYYNYKYDCPDYNQGPVISIYTGNNKSHLYSVRCLQD